MSKTLIITIMVDGVEYPEIEGIQEGLDDIFGNYEDKRITIQIQDEPLVQRPR